MATKLRPKRSTYSLNFSCRSAKDQVVQWSPMWIAIYLLSGWKSRICQSAPTRGTWETLGANPCSWRRWCRSLSASSRSHLRGSSSRTNPIKVTNIVENPLAVISALSYIVFYIVISNILSLSVCCHVISQKNCLNFSNISFYLYIIFYFIFLYIVYILIFMPIVQILDISH